MAVIPANEQLARVYFRCVTQCAADLETYVSATLLTLLRLWPGRRT